MSKSIWPVFPLLTMKINMMSLNHRETIEKKEEDTSGRLYKRKRRTPQGGYRKESGGHLRETIEKKVEDTSGRLQKRKWRTPQGDYRKESGGHLRETIEKKEDDTSGRL
ncbi:hypothetical protein BgiMline_028541 [Biomphalaria glabrata]